MIGFIASVFVLLLAVTDALALELDIPVDCTLGKNCFIQNYVDQAAGEDRQDYKCRKLSYDKHKGTDFAIPVFDAKAEGVKVLAAADGMVLGFRDGEKDALLSQKDPKSSANKECGNGVLIAHAGGWRTQYCHLKRGSIRVKKGQKVLRGEPLGEIGLSGKTEFPHLHIAVRDKAGTPIDPFNTNPMESGCGEAVSSLWSAKASSAMQVEGTGIVLSGIAGKPVKKHEVIQGYYPEKFLLSNADAMVFWTLLYGPQKGDKLVVQLVDSNSKILVKNTHQFEGFKAQYFQYVGKKRGKRKAWPVGAYQGKVTLIRGSQNIVDKVFHFEVK